MNGEMFNPARNQHHIVMKASVLNVYTIAIVMMGCLILRIGARIINACI